MKNVSVLNLIGGLLALAMAVVFFGGYAYLIKSIPLIIVFMIGLALMGYDLYLTTRDAADRRAGTDRR